MLLLHSHQFYDHNKETTTTIAAIKTDQAKLTALSSR